MFILLAAAFSFFLSCLSPFIICPLPHLSLFAPHFASATPAFTPFPSFFSYTKPRHPHRHTPTHPLFGCLCSTGSKSLAAACSSPHLPSLCTIALGTKLGPHNSRPVRVNSRANTVKAKTHFLLSPLSLAKN